MLFLALAACGSRHPLDDMTLSTEVKIELLQDPTLASARLDVSSLNGVVTLSGTVPTRADADRAVVLARHVHGVRDVNSQLKLP